MAGPRLAPWYFEGKRVHWRTTVAYCNNNTLSVVSMYDKVKFCLNSDIGMFDDPKGLLTHFEKIID